MAKEIVIAVGDSNCRDLHFRPLGSRVRGSFDVRTAAKHNHDMTSLMSTWDEEIPGQRIALDADKAVGAVLEPLYEDRYARIREKLEQRGMRLAPDRQEYTGVHVDSWLWYMRAAVDSGNAELLSGTFPDKIGRPKDSFVVTRVASEEQATIKQLVSIMYAMLTPEQQKQAESMLASSSF